MTNSFADRANWLHPGTIGNIDRAIAKVLQIDEPCRRPPEPLWRLGRTEDVAFDALLPDPDREAQEVAVRGDYSEGIDLASMEEIHGIDDQSDVRRILAPFHRQAGAGAKWHVGRTLPPILTLVGR
jgi:hypothetical protein